jgi:hypothetical protein
MIAASQEVLGEPKNKTRLLFIYCSSLARLRAVGGNAETANIQ